MTQALLCEPPKQLQNLEIAPNAFTAQMLSVRRLLEVSGVGSREHSGLQGCVTRRSWNPAWNVSGMSWRVLRQEEEGEDQLSSVPCGGVSRRPSSSRVWKQEGG